MKSINSSFEYYGHHKQFQLYTPSFTWITKDNVSVGGRCQLFNRPELCYQCALPETADISDYSIIGELYKKYGTKFVDYLLGDYALIIWDHVQQQLICITDHFNNFGLFYAKTPDTFCVSENIASLQALPAIGRRFNFRKIAMSNCFTAIHEPGETFFSNIYFVPAASIMRVDANKNLFLEQYWTPTLPSLRNFNSREDFSQAFQEVFAEVIRSHTNYGRPVMSLLSGGLDSSAVTAMTAKILFERGEQLTSLSAVLPKHYTGVGNDERYFIDLLQAPNLTKINITDCGRGPFDDLDSFIYSPFLTSRHYLYRAFNDNARAQGVNCILDGCFGEMGPSFWGDERLAELLRTGQWISLLKQSRLHHQLFQRSWKSIIFQDILQPNLPPAWQIKLKSRNDLDYIQRFSLIKSEFIKQFIDTENRKNEANKLKSIGAKSSVDGRKNNLFALQNVIKYLAPSNKVLYEQHKPEVRYIYPLRDKRMIDFCLSVPNEWRYRNGYRRNIIREGMRGLMPDEICFRTGKQPFSADFHDRYHRQITRARDYIEAIKSEPIINSIIDISGLLKYMKLSMTSNQCTTKNDFICMHIVPSAVYLAAFLTN